MANIIDSLVVTLDLDPKKFGSGAQAAQKKLTEFNGAIKKLGIDETKLTEQQKRRIDTLRQTEVQTARTGKELKSTETISKGLFSTLEKGALAFGAAMGVYGLKEFAMDAIHSGAALSRLSRTMGMSAQQADTWGKAVSESVGGSAAGALATVQGLSDELNGWQFGGSIDRVNRIVGLIRQATGAKITAFGPDGKPRSPQDFLKSIADPIRQMGPVKAHALLSGALDDDTINFLLQGRAGVDTALSKAAPNAITSKQAEDDRKLEQEMNQLGDAFGKLKNIILEIAAPSVLSGLKVMTAWVRYLRDPTAPGAAAARDNAIRAADADAHDTPDDPGGKRWLAAQDAEAALKLVQDPPSGGAHGAIVPPMMRYGAAIPKVWTQDQKRARLQQLLMDGETPASAAAIVTAEMAAGRAPGAQSGTTPIGSATPSGSLLDAIRSQESGGNSHAVSSKGARGAYQLMPGTAAQYGVTDPTNDDQARKGAAAYLTDLLAHYGGDISKALGAYNWGQGNLDKDIAAHGSQWAKFLPAETAAYIPQVLARAGGAGGGAAGGTTVIQQNGPVTIQTAATDAPGIARAWHKGVVAAASGGPS